MDSKTLAYVPTANLIAPAIIIYVLCRFLLLKIFQQNISFTKIALIVVSFFACGSIVGSYAVLLFYAVVFIIWHSFDAYRRPIRKLQRIEYTLVTTLFITLCVLMGIGQERKQDENWLLSHLNLIGGEINYERLQSMTPLQNLCSTIKSKEVVNNSHFRSIEFLSRLAIKQNDCHKEIQDLFQQSKNNWTYMALVHITPQEEPIWKDLCHHYVQFKNEDHYKFKGEDLQNVEDRVHTICSERSP